MDTRSSIDNERNTIMKHDESTRTWFKMVENADNRLIKNQTLVGLTSETFNEEPNEPYK